MQYVWVLKLHLINEIMYVYSRFKAGGGNLSTKQGYFVIVQIY